MRRSVPDSCTVVEVRRPASPADGDHSAQADLCAVVVNYRTPDLTLQCLRSYAVQRRPGDLAVVVDNNSGDDSAEAIEQGVAEYGWDPWCRVVRSPVNGGFSAGNNLGLRAVAADYYLLINSDAVLLDGALDALRAALEPSSCLGLVGPAYETPGGAFQPAAFRDAHPVSELLRAARTGFVSRLLRRFDLQHDPQRGDADWIGFACVLIRRQVMEQVGLLDEGYFMYFEDLDYCRRARAAGWRIGWTPAARAIHDSGQSSESSVTSESDRRLPRYYYEARARYFARHYGRAGLWLANFCWVLGRGISWSRELVRQKQQHLRQGEARDIWTNVWRPLERGTRIFSIADGGK